MSFLNDLTTQTIRAIFAFCVLIASIVGFFMSLIPAEFFTGIVGLVISHYFESQKTQIVQNELNDAKIELQHLKKSDSILTEDDLKIKNGI